MTLDEARAAIGRKAVYRQPGEAGSGVEEGVITEVRSFRSGADPFDGGYVFVRYGGDTIAKATRPEDLEFIS